MGNACIRGGRAAWARGGLAALVALGWLAAAPGGPVRAATPASATVRRAHDRVAETGAVRAPAPAGPGPAGSAGLAPAAGWPVWPAQGDGAGETAEVAHDALQSAAAAKRAASRLGPEEKDAALEAVVGSYRAILGREDFPAAARAEAAFRAGEIERTRKQVDLGDALFARAVELGGALPVTAPEADGARDFAARALLERAHIRRRAKDVAGALAAYAEVRERFGDRRRSAAHARTWTGKLLLADGERARAAEALLGFLAAYPEYPAEAVRNTDLYALELLEAGDEEGAREAVSRLRLELAPILEAGGKPAESVRRALDGLRVTEQLGGD